MQSGDGWWAPSSGHCRLATWLLNSGTWGNAVLGSPCVSWDNKIILEKVNSARPPAAPGADVLITVGSQEEEHMRSGAKLLEEALKPRTGALGSGLKHETA